MKTPDCERPHPTGEGVQKIYRFKNGYGASVIRTPMSYGGTSRLWELAVIKFQSANILDYRLCYTTPITDDVIGYLNGKEVDVLLTKIEGLKKEVKHATKKQA